MRIKKIMGEFWPIGLFLGLILGFFWKFFLKGLLPIPSDIVTGMYFPWLDYKWGFPVGVPVKNSILTDAVSQFWPWRNLAIDFLKKGEVLFWNPYSGSGAPLVPLFHSALFSPLNFFYWLFPKETAMSLIVISQPLLALFFTYWFLTELGLRRIASVLGAIVFTFGSFMTLWLSWGTVGAVGAALPMVLWGLEKWLKTGKFRFALFQILALSFGLHNATLQVFFYLVLFWLTWAVFRILSLDSKNQRRKFLLEICLIFLGFLLINAFAILPAYQALKFSIRGVEDYLGQRNYGFIPPSHLIKLLAPDFFGNPATANYWGELNYQELAVYFGLLPLVLAFLAAWRRKKDRLVLFFLFSGLVFLGLALKYPFGWLIYKLNLPLLGKASASRILFLFNFCGAVLAAFGLEEFSRSEWKSLEKVILIFSGAIFGIGSGALIALNWLKSSPLYLISDFLNPWEAKIKIGLRNLVLPFLILALISVIFYLKRLRRKRFDQVLVFGLVALTVFELFRFGLKYIPFTPKELFFPKTPVLKFLEGKEGIFRIEKQRGPILPPNMWIPFGLESASIYDPVMPLDYARFFQQFGGRDPNRYLELDVADFQFFDLLNIKYFLVLKYAVSGDISFEGNILPHFRERFSPVFEGRTVVVLENESVWPRAFLVKKEFLSEKPTVFDPQAIKKSWQKGEVLITNYSPQFLELEVKTDEESVLLVSNTNFPGWQAYLNGNKTETKENFLPFLSILVPKGENRVVFKYQPELLRTGSWLSLAGLFLILLELIRRKLVQSRGR
jgi:hypothetical protein